MEQTKASDIIISSFMFQLNRDKIKQQSTKKTEEDIKLVIPKMATQMLAAGPPLIFHDKIFLTSIEIILNLI